MSGGNEAVKFNHLVTENIINNLHIINKFGAQKMSSLRNQLYVDIIKRKCAIDDEMLQAVIDASECPLLSFDAFYSDR